MNANVRNAAQATTTAQPSADALEPLPVERVERSVEHVTTVSGFDAIPGFADLAEADARGRAVAVRDATRYEALALGAMAGASLPAVWIAQGRPTAWVAIAVLLGCALSALHPRLAGGTFGRGSGALCAAALLAVSAPDLASVAALWSVVIVGVLTTRLPGDTGWLLTAAGGGMLAMLETVLSLMADPLGVTSGPSGVLLAGAAGTIGAGTVGSAVAHRLALGGTGWTLDTGFGGDGMWSGAGAVEPLPVPDGASTDPLTGMATRGVLLRGITRALARVDVIGGRVALFVLDVDRFDLVATRHGEKRANEVLRHLARRLRAAMPAEDVVARIGPTTFAVLVEGVGPDGCEPMVHRMAALLEEQMIVGGAVVAVTCSVGTAIADADLDSPERLVRAAGTAMHAAQTAGRGRWVHHDPAMGAHVATRDGLEAELVEAVSNGAIEVAVQPIVDLAADTGSDATGGVELLARWSRDDGTPVPPQHFVALAEELGIGSRLGDLVIDRAVELLTAWDAADGETSRAPRYVAVNVSRSQLEDPAFARSVADRLADRGLAASRLAVEVSAATFVDTDQARRTLGMLRSLGVGVTVDDFGRGSLGLLALRQLPVDTVKVDRQVTMELGRDDTVAATVLTLCRAMGRRCVAEGVETTAQLEAARRLGMDGAQGFLLGRPVPPGATPPRHV